MATRIRLRRMGSKRRPYYRLVVADSRSPRDGRFIEILGYYHPLDDPAKIQVDEEKALEWLNKGAKASESASAILRKTGILQRFNVEKSGRRQPKESPTTSEVS